jgi:hypothetical protein
MRSNNRRLKLRSRRKRERLLKRSHLESMFKVLPLKVLRLSKRRAREARSHVEVEEVLPDLTLQKLEEEAEVATELCVKTLMATKLAVEATLRREDLSLVSPEKMLTQWTDNLVWVKAQESQLSKKEVQARAMLASQETSNTKRRAKRAKKPPRRKRRRKLKKKRRRNQRSSSRRK